MSLSLVLIAVAIYQVSFPGVEAVQCYSCSDCGDPFSSSGVSKMTCPSSCMKTKGKVGDIEVVIRGCGALAGDQCAESTYQGAEATLCTCTTDLCNEASLTNAPVLLVITMATILFLAKQLIV